MGDNFFDNFLQSLADVLSTYIMAFVHVYEAIFDEKARENISIFEIIIVLTSLGFVLYFMRSVLSKLLGLFSKSHKEQSRHKRFISHLKTMGDNDNDENLK